MENNLENLETQEKKALTLEDLKDCLKESGVEDVEGALKGLYEELKALYEEAPEEEDEDKKFERIFG